MERYRSGRNGIDSPRHAGHAERNLNRFNILYYVYILQSELDKEFYVGRTGNLKIRYSEHQTGRVESTKNCFFNAVSWIEKMNTQKIKIPALDGFKLGGLILKPRGRSKGIIQFHNGTVTKKEFYLNFCTHFCEADYTVIMFDYRGVGESRPKHLRGFNASIIDWGRLDMPGVLGWADKTYPNQKKFIIAHSMGGQVIGLMNNINLLNGIVVIAGSYGNWKNYSGSNKYFSAIIWCAYFPLATKLFGYLPLKRFGMGEDLPAGAAKDLWNWCWGNYTHSEIMERNKIKNYYHDIKKPIMAYFIEDDSVTTARTIPMFRADFSSALLDIEIIKPSGIGAEKIGHYGFFSERLKDRLWNRPLDWIGKL